MRQSPPSKKGRRSISRSLSRDGGANDPAFHLAALADMHEAHLQELHLPLHNAYALMVV